jgi:hypothetical protein
MIRLLRFIITGSWHEHKWEIHDMANVTVWLNGKKDELPINHITTYVQKGSVCGKLKSFKVTK